MASIQKRGNSYRVTVSNGYDINGKKIVETDTFTPEPGMKPKEIQKALAEFVVDFEREVKFGKNVKGGKMTFQKLAQSFMEDMKPPELARSTYSDYRRRLTQRIIPAIGHIKIGAINQKTIKNYTAMLEDNYERKGRRQGGPLKDSSVRKDCCVISSILSYGVWEGYLTINPLIYSGKRRGRRKTAKEYRVQYFTMEQLIRFIDALESDMAIIRPGRTCHKKDGTTYVVSGFHQPYKVSTKWKLFFYLLIFCGDRRGENISLTWNDFNFSTGVVTIDKSTSYVDGISELNDTKTHNVRDNTVPPYVISIAKKLRAEEIEKCVSLGDQWKGYHGKEFNKNFIFTQDNGTQMHISSPYNMYKKIIRIYNSSIAQKEEDKIPDNITMHGLRHSAAAIMISNNLDARTVADLLGHADPTTTLNIYSYFFKDKGKEAAAIMENTLLKKSVVTK